MSIDAQLAAHDL